MINRLRISCISGPWLDGECVRYIDVPDSANLYDLHVAIQDSVQFDEEFPFYFFTALSPEGKRSMIPDDLDPNGDPESIDEDVYEDIEAIPYTPPNAKKSLFYIFTSEYDDWVFKIQHTGDIHEPVEREFYPLVLDQLAVGPHPEQYGSGFDDFAESEDEFRPRAKVRGDADYCPEDEPGEEGDDPFGFGDDLDDDDGDELDDDL